MDEIIHKIFNKRNILTHSGIRVNRLIIDRNTYNTIKNDKNYFCSNIVMEDDSEMMLGFEISIIETYQEIITFDFEGRI